MKNKWLKVMAFAFALMFTLSFGVIKAQPVMAASEQSEEATSLQDNLSGMLQQFNTTAEIDSYLEQMVSQYEQYYGEGYGDEIKEMYSFLYDWVDIKKSIGDYKKVTDFSYEEDKDSGEITSATMKVECEKGTATLNYTVDSDGNVKVTIEKKATMGELMEKAALNTLMGMGTVFVVLIFMVLIISCSKFIGGGNKKESNENAAAVAAPQPVVEEVEEDVTDDLELVAVITAAIAASEGTSSDGFRVRSIKRVRRSNW